MGPPCTRLVLLIAVAVLALLGTCGGLEARSGKPKVIPGRDPGGVAVAVIGAGIDYSRAEMAARLARDGEGELIGWDFADNDARPFSGDNADGRLAALALGEGQAAGRLVVARVAPGRQDQIAAALRFAGETPARIVLVLADPGRPLTVGQLAEAAQFLRPMLIVVPAHRVEGVAPVAGEERAGLIIVTAEGQAAAKGPADVAVASLPGELAGEGGAADDAAAARLVAIARRVAAGEPGLDGAGLRANLLRLAKVRPGALPMLEGP